MNKELNINYLNKLLAKANKEKNKLKEEIGKINQEIKILEHLLNLVEAHSE